MDHQDQESMLLSKERLELLIGLTLTDSQYKEMALAIFEIASIIIETA
jgi:hypothetical protein